MAVRDILLAIVTLLFIPFIVNQLSSRLDFRWSIWAAVAAGLIAVGLFLTSDLVTQRVWADIGKRHRALTIVITALITGGLGAGAAALLISTSAPRGDIT